MWTRTRRQKCIRVRRISCSLLAFLFTIDSDAPFTGSYGGDQSGASTCKSKYSRANLLLFYLKHAHTLKDDKDEVIIDLSSRKTFLEKSITSALMDSFSQIY